MKLLLLLIAGLGSTAPQAEPAQSQTNQYQVQQAAPPQQAVTPQPQQAPVQAPSASQQPLQNGTVQQPAAQSKPCPAPSPKAPAPKGFHFTIPKALRTVIDKQRSTIEDKTGVHVPTPEQIAKQAQAAACPQPAPVQSRQ